MGRGKKHEQNAASKTKMRQHPFYQKYIKRGVENAGAPGGYFGNLQMHYGMAFDLKGTVEALRSNGKNGSLFVWSKEYSEQLNNHHENISVSPGFEALELRVNNKRRKLNE